MNCANRLLILFLTIASISTAQESWIHGVVTDNTGNPIAASEVITYKGKHITETDSLGRFSFMGEEKVKYGLAKNGFELKWFLAKVTKDPMQIVMLRDVQEIESVIITRKGAEEALDLQNVNIIDYQPLQGYILTLKKKKDSYYVGIDSLNTEGLSIPISIEKPRELFYDCMQNTFILNQEKAYQFVILDGEMKYISEMPIASFNTYIRPCVADFDGALVLSNLSDHNKRYKLTRYENGVGVTFFSELDTIGYEVAMEDALMIGQTNGREFIGDSINDNLLAQRQEMREIHNGENPDVNLQMLKNSQKNERSQSDEPMSAQEQMHQNQQMSHSSYDSQSSTWSQAQASYMLRSQPIKIQSFRISNYVAVVNYDVDSVFLFDDKGIKMQSKPFMVPSDIKDVWQDLATDFLYLYTKDNGNHKLYSLNALTGEVNYLKNFRGTSHTKSGLVYDSWLYYRFIENGFYGIKRVKLPEGNFQEWYKN